MKPSEAERLLLSSIQKPTHLVELRNKYKITASHFPFFPKEAEFVWSYVTEYGKAPTPEIMSANCPNLELSPAQDFDYISEQFHDVVLSRHANLIFFKAQELLDGSNPRIAYPYVIGQLQNMLQTEEDHRAVLDSNPINRINEYRARRQLLENENRFRTGIQRLDEQPMTLKPGQVFGILADAKAGKTWLSMKMAAQMYMAGAKVLVISPELTMDELKFRSDILFAQMLGHELSYTALELAQETQEEKYEAYLTDFIEYTMGRDDWILSNAGMTDDLTVEEISNYVTQEKPDVLVLDGISNMSVQDRKLESWEKYKVIGQGLKNVADKQHLLAIVTNQSNRDAEDFGPPRPKHSAYSFDFCRRVDILLCVGKTQSSTLLRTCTVPLRRDGPEIHEEFDITFDADSGSIGSKPDPALEIPIIGDIT